MYHPRYALRQWLLLLDLSNRESAAVSGNSACRRLAAPVAGVAVWVDLVIVEGQALAV